MKNCRRSDHCVCLLCICQHAVFVLQAPAGKSDVWGTDVSGDVELDEEKLKAALKKQRAAQAAKAELDDRKRKYNSLAGGEEVTPEEMEAYRMTRSRADDPMAKLLTTADDD